MAEPELPLFVERFVEAINQGDTEAFLDLFMSDGVVNDWGRRFVGRDEIRKWSDKELIGAKGRLTITTPPEQQGSKTIFMTEWKSSYFSGTGRFTISRGGDRIRELKISEA